MRGGAVGAHTNPLAAELASTHPDIARKLQAQHDLYARLHPDAGGHRPLTEAEMAEQADATLTAEELAAAQRVEYGTYVAATDIHVGNALAYAIGHPVPVSAVILHGYLQTGQVQRVRAAARPVADTATEGE